MQSKTYYIGTLSQCEYYNNKVSEGEKYLKGDNWSDPIQDKDESLYLIKKHPKYTHSRMEEVEEIPSNFHKETDL